MDSWEEAEELGEEIVPDELKAMNNEQLAGEFQILRAKQKEINERLKHINTMLSAQVNEEPGRYVLDAGRMDIIVTRQEKYEWSDGVLEKMFGKPPATPGDQHPDYARVVGFGYKVEATKFKKMPDGTAKQSLMNALTRKPGSTSIKVLNKGEGDTDEN